MLFLLLPVAAGSGWYWGFRSAGKPEKTPSAQLSRNYFTGLNYLLNEQPDRAVDIFIKAFEIDSETIDTYLAIGNLFRRRGEVERAIRIHQNLIARPNLEKNHRIQALIELGRDYLHAGVYDRAERLFLEAEEIGTQPNILAYRSLLVIYQQEHDWQKAIEYAEKLLHTGQADIRSTLANYYCELVIDKRQFLTDEKKLSLLAEALKIDRDCARASLLEGAIQASKENYPAAIKAYQRVKEQDSDFLIETVTPLAECYEKIGKQQALIEYLYDCLEQSPQPRLITIFAEKIAQWKNHQAAIEFLQQQLHKSPSLMTLEYLLNFYQDTLHVQPGSLKTVHKVIQDLVKDNPGYQCNHCGFLSKLMQWLCPGCRRWNAIKPVGIKLISEKIV